MVTDSDRACSIELAYCLRRLDRIVFPHCPTKAVERIPCAPDFGKRRGYTELHWCPRRGLIYCIHVDGLCSFFEKRLARSQHGGIAAKSDVPFSRRSLFYEIAAHEVRHRLQFEDKLLPLFTLDILAGVSHFGIDPATLREHTERRISQLCISSRSALRREIDACVIGTVMGSTYEERKHRNDLLKAVVVLRP